MNNICIYTYIYVYIYMYIYNIYIYIYIYMYIIHIYVLCILFNIMFNNHHNDVYEANILVGDQHFRLTSHNFNGHASFTQIGLLNNADLDKKLRLD